MDQETLNQFNKDRTYLLSYLRHDPLNFANSLYNERTIGPFWNRQTEISSPFLTMNNPTLCCLIGVSITPVQPNICLISVVNPLGHQGKEGETKLVQSGSIRNPQYSILKIFNIDNLDIRYFQSPITNINYVSSISQQSLSCFYPNIQNLQYIGSDNFTNEYLVGFILHELYSKSNATGLNGVVKFIAATICNTNNTKKGTIIMDYADFGDINGFVRNPLTSEYRQMQNYFDQSGNTVQYHSLKLNVILDIFKQVVSNLDFLHSQLEFNHGDFKINNILLKSIPSIGNYKGCTWNSDFTIQIADFAKSSLTITDSNNQRIRLFNISSSANTYLNIFPFKPSIGIQFDQPYYILNSNTNLSSLAHIRHMGIPFYYSFDLYTFVISILLVPEIFFPIMSNVQMKQKIFDILWFEDEYSTIWNRLYNAVQQKKRNSYTLILNILSGLKLKCQATTLLLKSLQTI